MSASHPIAADHAPKSWARRSCVYGRCCWPAQSGFSGRERAVEARVLLHAAQASPAFNVTVASFALYRRQGSSSFHDPEDPPLKEYQPLPNGSPLASPIPDDFA
jgi:hypothetical protein